jgi:tetratricopeptide (TPR) repeat protein
MNDIASEQIELEERIARGSGKVDDYFKLGKLYLESAQYASLLALYERLEKQSLSEVELARLYYERGDALEPSNRNEAIASFRKSLQHISPNDYSVEALFLRGLCHHSLFLLVTDPDERRSNGEEAIKDFKLILDKRPAFEDKYALFSYIADIYTMLNEHREALSFYNGALRRSANAKERIGALTGIGVVLGKQKKARKAEKYFDTALQEATGIAPTSKIHYEKGKMLFESNDFRKAYEEFKQALESIHNDPGLRGNKDYQIEIFWHLGTIAYELKEDEKAIGYLSRILEEVDEPHYYYASANLTLGHIWLFKQDYARAREHYNSVLSAPRSFEPEKSMAKKCIGEIPLDS